MTAKQAFDQTILKFEKLAQEGKEPDWKILSCPICCNQNGCGEGCSLYQYDETCYNYAKGLDIYDNSYEILLMLYQIRIYLYGESDTLDFIKTRKGLSPLTISR